MQVHWPYGNIFLKYEEIAAAIIKIVLNELYSSIFLPSNMAK